MFSVLITAVITISVPSLIEGNHRGCRYADSTVGNIRR
jgi:hypothetical protein